MPGFLCLSKRSETEQSPLYTDVCFEAQLFRQLQPLSNLCTSFVSRAYSVHQIKMLTNVVWEAVVLGRAKYSGQHSAGVKIDFHVISDVQMQLPVTQTGRIV